MYLSISLYTGINILKINNLNQLQNILKMWTEITIKILFNSF